MEAYDRTSRRLHHLAIHLGPILEDRARARPAFGGGLSVQPCSVVGGRESFQRRDNRTLFARQCTDDQGQFMRQAQVNEDLQLVQTKERKDPPPSFATVPRSVSDDVSKSQGVAGSATKTSKLPSADDGRDPSFATVEPLFGRPAPETEYVGPNPPNAAGKYRKSEVAAGRQDSESSSTSDGKGKGFEWFPRMDVVESGMAYVITLELPGVCVDGIHVEIVRSSLIVTGSRATDWWKLNKNGSNGGDAVYHLRELAQGPYRAVWRLPKNSDINGISAEFINGFLRILVPKVKITTYL